MLPFATWCSRVVHLNFIRHAVLAILQQFAFTHSSCLFSYPAHAIQHLLTVSICVQFVNTMEANIFATLSVVANMTINNVTPGSIQVDNSVAFTGADAAAATTAQRQFALLVDPKNANSLSSIYGTSFGTVTVSGVTLTNSTNPSKCFPTVILSLVEALVLGSVNHWVFV